MVPLLLKGLMTTQKEERLKRWREKKCSPQRLEMRWQVVGSVGVKRYRSAGLLYITGITEQRQLWVVLARICWTRTNKCCTENGRRDKQRESKVKISSFHDAVSSHCWVSNTFQAKCAHLCYKRCLEFWSYNLLLWLWTIDCYYFCPLCLPLCPPSSMFKKWRSKERSNGREMIPPGTKMRRKAYRPRMLCSISCSHIN